MENNSPKSRLGSDPQQDSPHLTAESASNDEDEGFDAFGLSRSLSNFLSDPALLVDMTSINDEAISTFIRQINHPDAKDTLARFGCLRRYSNETETGIWIQETAFKFLPPWVSRCDWENCGELKPEEDEEKNEKDREKPPKDYQVYYWTHKKIPNLKFRKYCIKGLHYAVFLVFSSDSEGSRKKRKTTMTNEAVGQSQESAPEQVCFPREQNSFQLAQFPSNTAEPTAAYPYPNNSFQQTEIASQNAIPAVMYHYIPNNNNMTSHYHSEQTPVMYNETSQNNTDQTSYNNLDQIPLYQQSYVQLPQNNTNLMSYDNPDPNAIYQEPQLDWYQLVIENTKRSQNNEQEIAKLTEKHDALTAKHVRLEMTTLSNTIGIEDLTDSVAKLEIHSQKQIISAIIKILRDNGGTFPAGSKFASKVRDLLGDKSITTKEVNGTLKNILEKRGVVKRSNDKTNWILNEPVAKKFELK